MPTIREIRAMYPQYSDLDDSQLMDGLYRKHYSDMPRPEFDQRMGVQKDPQPTTADAVAEVGEFGVRGVNKALAGAITAPYRAVDWVGEKITGGDFLPNMEDTPLWSKYLKQPEPKTDAGRYAGAVGEAIGSSAIPTAALVRAAPAMAALAPTSTPRAIAQTIGQNVAASPRAAVAADVVASTGAGIGQQAAEDAGFGPGGQALAGVVGGMTPFGVAAAARGIVNPVRRAIANQGEAGAYGSIADDLGMSVDEFTEAVARGNAAPATIPNNQRVIETLGEEMVRANGDVQRAQQATIARISREQGVTHQTAATQIRTLSQQYEDNPLMFGEIQATMDADRALRGPTGGLRRAQNVDVDELNRQTDSTTQATLDYLANAGNAQSAMNVRNAVSARQPELADNMRDVIADMAPRVGTATGRPLPAGSRGTTRPATIVDAEGMIDDARRAGSSAYQAAYNGPINNNVSMYWLPRLLDYHANRAAGRAGEPAAAIRRAVDQFYLNTPHGRIAMNTLQQLQDARGAVRGIMEEYRRAGRNDLLNATQPFYEHITRLMSNMSPQWAQANRQWADMNFLRMGQELGDAFATRAGPQYREQLREFRNLAPQAQDIVRVHVLQQIYDKLDNLGDTHSISKLFNNDQTRNMIRELFGPEALVSMVRAVRNQRIAESSQGMLRNSATHRRGVAQKQKDSETGLVAAAQNANAQGVKNWLLEKATQIVTERRNRPMARVLTTPMSDTANVAMHLERMRQQQNRLNRFSQPRISRRGSVGIHGATPAALEDLTEEDR